MGEDGGGRHSRLKIAGTQLWRARKMTQPSRRNTCDAASAWDLIIHTFEREPDIQEVLKGKPICQVLQPGETHTRTQEHC